MSQNVATYTLGACLAAFSGGKITAQSAALEVGPPAPQQTVSEQFRAYAQPIMEEPVLPLAPGTTQRLGGSLTFKPELAGNSRVFEGADAAAVAQAKKGVVDKFVADFKAEKGSDHIILARQLIGIATRGFGDPTWLTAAVPGGSAVAALPDAKIAQLWEELTANPFLAAIWNARCATPNDYYSSMLQTTPPTSPLIMPVMTPAPPGSWLVEFDIVRREIVRKLDKLNHEFEAQPSGQNNLTVEERFARFGSRIQTLLPHAEKLVEAVAGPGGIEREAVASALTIAILASTPGAWGHQSLSAELFDSAIDLAVTISTPRAPDAQRRLSDIISREMAPRLRAALNVLVQEVQKDADPARVLIASRGALDVLREVLVLARAPGVGSKNRTVIDGLTAKIEGSTSPAEDLVGYGYDHKVKILSERIKSGGVPGADMSALVTPSGLKEDLLYALMRLSPLECPELYLALATLESKGAGISVPPTIRNVDRLLAVLSTASVEEAGAIRDQMLERLIEGAENLEALSTEGVSRLALRQSQILESLANELLKHFGVSGEEMKAEEPFLEPDKVGKANIGAEIRTPGTVTFGLLRELEAVSLAAMQILETLTPAEATGPYAKLRERILRPSARQTEIFLTPIDFCQLVQQILEDPNIGSALLSRFKGRMEEDKRELIELVNSCNGAGGRSRVLDDRIALIQSRRAGDAPPRTAENPVKEPVEPPQSRSLWGWIVGAARATRGRFIISRDE